MPFIKIKSNPFQKKMDIPLVIEKVGVDFSQATNINIEQITVTWEYFLNNHYWYAGKTTEYQNNTNHPILVDLLIPGFNSKEKIGLMLNAIATSLSKHLRVKTNEVFINCSLAESGLVYDGGKIASW